MPHALLRPARLLPVRPNLPRPLSLFCLVAVAFAVAAPLLPLIYVLAGPFVIECVGGRGRGRDARMADGRGRGRR